MLQDKKHFASIMKAGLRYCLATTAHVRTVH
jgi:hypothetical protein